MALFKAREALESSAIVSALGKEASLEKQKRGRKRGGGRGGCTREENKVRAVFTLITLAELKARTHHPPTKPQLSVPTPPGPPPGKTESKTKHTPGMYQHTNMASAQTLHSAPLLFLQDVWGSGHRSISLSPPAPPPRPRCGATGNVLWKVSAAGLGRWSAGPRWPLGASSGPTRAAPPRGPVVPGRSASETDELCLQVRTGLIKCVSQDECFCFIILSYYLRLEQMNSIISNFQKMTLLTSVLPERD